MPLTRNSRTTLLDTLFFQDRWFSLARPLRCRDGRPYRVDRRTNIASHSPHNHSGINEPVKELDNVGEAPYNDTPLPVNLVGHVLIQPQPAVSGDRTEQPLVLPIVGQE